MNAKFDQMLALEDTVNTHYALAAMGSDWQTRARGESNLAKAKADLFAMFDELTAEEAKAFGEYRKAAKRAQEITKTL